MHELYMRELTHIHESLTCDFTAVFGAFVGQLASRVVEQVVDMDKQLLLFLKQVRERTTAAA